MSEPTAASAAITDLTAIDSDITTLLSTASSAIRTLTTPPGDERQFREHAALYHQLLSSISVRLRRQIIQLQTAEIPVITGGAIDVGVLNSRNDVVGREMEAECWAAARAFLEKVGREREGGEGSGYEMEVDSS